MTTFYVEERGRGRLQAGEWKLLRTEQSFWQLVASGIVEVSARSGGGADLLGRGFVGRARVGGEVLECNEKIPGAFSSLLGAVYPAVRLTRSPAPTTPLGEMFSLLLTTFIAETRAYVSRGREWRYRRRQETSPILGGRLLVPQTVRLRARGRGYLLAFDKEVLDRKTHANKLLFRALQEVEKLRALVTIPDADVYSVRGLQLYFEDCRDYEYSVAAPARLAQEAEKLSVESTNVSLANSLALAAIVLSHSSFEHDGDWRSHDAPLSWFANLESMFERAVFESLSRSVATGRSVRHGRTIVQPIFPETRLYNADPDLVVQAYQRVVVGDVKYKEWSKKASSSDIYQLLAHARAFGSTEAFLVFPDSTWSQHDLGLSTSGVRVQVFTIDVRNIEADVARIVASYEL